MAKLNTIIIWLVLLGLFIVGGALDVPLLRFMAAIPLILWSLKEAVKSNVFRSVSGRIFAWLVLLAVYFAPFGLLSTLAGLILLAFSFMGAVRK